MIMMMMIYSFRVFHISVSWWFFTRSLSNSKSTQLSRTCLRILAVLSNVVIWIVSTRPPTSKSSRPFNNPLVIVPNAPITIGTSVTFMFHSFFNSLARSRYLSFFSHSFITIIIIIIIIITPCEFITTSSADVWMITNLLGSRNSSQYSIRSQQICSLGGVGSFSDFQHLQSPDQDFVDRS